MSPRRYPIKRTSAQPPGPRGRFQESGEHVLSLPPLSQPRISTKSGPMHAVQVPLPASGRELDSLALDSLRPDVYLELDQKPPPSDPWRSAPSSLPLQQLDASPSEGERSTPAMRPPPPHRELELVSIPRRVVSADFHAAVLAFAGFGSPPHSLWATPAYALHVAERRRALARELASARAHRSPDVALYESAMHAADHDAVAKGIMLVALLFMIGAAFVVAAALFGLHALPR